ncbi:MAG: glycosyltransferase [Acidobacteriota bacterium]
MQDISALIPSPAMADAPYFSVLVPFFDSADTVEACAEALLAQVDADDEIERQVELLFIDNASTDDAPQRIERLAARDPRLRLLHETTPGAYAARNAGLRAARGHVVAFTDADCTPGPTWLRSIREALDDPTVGIVLGRCRYPSGASWPLNLLGAYENAKTDYVLRRCGPAHRFGYTNNLAARREIFDALGPFKPWRRAADSEMVHRLAARRPDLSVVYEPSMVVVHHEFRTARQRLARLRTYTGTNTQIETFRELGRLQRLGVAAHLLRGWRRFL